MGKRRKRPAQHPSPFEDFLDALLAVARRSPAAGAAVAVAAAVGGAVLYRGQGLAPLIGVLLYLLAGLVGVAALGAWVRSRPSTPAAGPPATPAAAPAPAAGPAPAAPRDGRAFEQLVARLYRAMGYAVEETGCHGDGTDGGIDLVCRWPASADPAHGDAGVAVLVQCKDLAKGYVSVGQVRAFWGGVCSARGGPARAVFATTGFFSADARALAAETGIELLDGPKLARRLNDYGLPLPAGIATADREAPAAPGAAPPRGTGNLPVRAGALDDSSPAPRPARVPVCPRCRVPMRHYPAGHGRTMTPFFGCPNFPKCRQTVRAT